MESYMQLGLNIRFYRRYKDYKQEGLSEKAGISTVYLSKIENAHSVPSLHVIFSIAKALQIPVHKLFEFRE